MRDYLPPSRNYQNGYQKYEYEAQKRCFGPTIWDSSPSLYWPEKLLVRRGSKIESFSSLLLRDMEEEKPKKSDM